MLVVWVHQSGQAGNLAVGGRNPARHLAELQTMLEQRLHADSHGLQAEVVGTRTCWCLPILQVLAHEAKSNNAAPEVITFKTESLPELITLQN